MKITLRDCVACADSMGIIPELVQTVANVESQSDPSAFLFEPHVFSRITNRKYDLSHPDLSYLKWDRTKYPKRREDRIIQFNRALTLEPLRAYEAASWGLFQIMGFNYKICGFGSALGMAQYFQTSVVDNVDAFGKMIRHMGLIDTLRNKEWTKFARVYNGPGYALNNYHLKMASEYDRIINSKVA